jgi:hypothetical protein
MMMMTDLDHQLQALKKEELISLVKHLMTQVNGEAEKLLQEGIAQVLSKSKAPTLDATEGNTTNDTKKKDYKKKEFDFSK